MRMLRALGASLIIVTMCFTGCLEFTNFNEKKDDVNRAPEALIVMPRQGSVQEAGKPFQIDGSASSDPDGDELQYMWLSLIHI